MNLYEYFQTYADYFWKWEDNGEVIEIPSGSTIAYTELVKEIMALVQDQGLPPFGSLLLFLIATNKTVDNALGHVENIVSTHLVQEQQFSHDNSNILSEAMAFLQRLSELSGSYKSGNRRLLLFQALFRECHNMISAQKAKKITEAFLGKVVDQNTLLKVKAFHTGIFSRDFKTIALLNRKYPSTRSIMERMAELPEIEFPDPEEELPQETAEKDFVDQLIEHPATFRIGNLIRPIWAGFKVPINTATPSQQPFGGISDLTNKGDFDKLLISEFAYDDLTFMSRLANNESLYLHREIPPAADDRQRILLADISLMSWGTPKTLVYACCIAMARHPKTIHRSLAFAVGATYYPVTFDNIDEVIDGLQKTSPSLHPAAGMDLVLKEYSASANPEVFLVIAADALKQSAVQRVISEYHTLFRYIITVDQQGHIAFYRYRQGNRKLIQQISLDLEKLWQQDIKETKPDRQEPGVLPETQYPILFATPQNIKATLKSGEQLYCVADRKLFVRTTKANTTKGFAIAKTQLPPSESFALGRSDKEDILFLYFNPQNKELCIANLDTGITITTVFKEWKITATDFFFHEDRFYHLNHIGNYAIIIRDEEIVIEVVKENISALRKIKAQKEEEQKALKQIQSKKNVLKNVHSVSINNVDNLIFNQHELRIHQGLISISSSGFKHINIAATANGRKNVFEFPDKSTVTINPSGMFILTSSNPSIPIIYVPSVLNAALGVSTREHFAGNDYYSRVEELNMKEGYTVTLLEAGTRKIEVIKIFQNELGIGLKEGKEIADAFPPIKVKEYLDQKTARRVLNRLTAHGAIGKIDKTEVSDHTTRRAVLNTATFHERYIQAFIQHITRYATTDKTT